MRSVFFWCSTNVPKIKGWSWALCKDRLQEPTGLKNVPNLQGRSCSESLIPRILKLGIRWSWVVNSIPRLFYPQERGLVSQACPQADLDGVLCRIEPQFVGRLHRSLCRSLSYSESSSLSRLGLTLKTLHFVHTTCLCVCFVWVPTTAIISVRNIRLVWLTEAHCVLCYAQTEYIKCLQRANNCTVVFFGSSECVCRELSKGDRMMMMMMMMIMMMMQVYASPTSIVHRLVLQ